VPLYKVTLYQRLTALNGEQWTNSFWVNQLGPSSALDSGESLAVALMSQSIQACEVWRLAARENGVGEAAVRSITEQGTRDVDPVNMIPFFNTVRMVLNDTEGRNQSHYLRGYLAEANVEGFNVSGELRTAMETDVLGGVLGVLGLRGPNGESITGGTIQSAIQMRQIGWHRRTRPGFKRGWVPV
jgi:hypothetical protein